MSFLDEDQATVGQISLGTRRAGLESLLPRRRRRQAAQQQQTSGYDILPSTMQPIPGVVSTPTDIAQVGVGQQLQQQGTTAAQVPNVFERYAETGAAPIGDFRQYLYPSPPTEEDEEEENDVIEATNEEFAENFGFDPYDPQTSEGQYNLSQQAAAEQAQAYEASILSGAGTGQTSLPISQSLKAAWEAAKYDLTGGKTGRSYNESLLNYAINLDVDEPVDLDTEAGAKDAAAMFGITVDDGSGAATGPAPAATNFDPTGGIDFSDPSISVGDGGGDGGDAAAPSTDFDPTGGIDPNIFASGGIVTKSKTKNKTSFMSMKGK